MIRPSNSGMATPGGGVVGAEPGVGRLPLGPGRARRRRLDDGHVESGQGARRPTPRRRGRRARRSIPAPAADATGGEDGGDQHVDAGVAEQRRPPARPPVPQRVAPHGERLPARRLDGVAQVGDELGVPGHEVGPVEDDATSGRAGSPLRRAPARRRRRATCRGRVEPEALEQDGVGHEAQEVVEVLRPAVDEVGERLGHRGRRDRGQAA